MANEAVLVFETELPIPITVADGSGLEKGTCLKLSDPFTGAASSADNDLFGGILAEEKIVSDGRTKCAAYFGGVFKMAAGAAGFTVGKPVVYSGANLVVDTTAADNDLGYIVGKALETAATGETGLVFVGRM